MLTETDIIEIRDQVLPSQGEAFDFVAFARALERRLLDTPELEDFTLGIVLEALHQRRRWGVDHDVGKEPGDWLWLIGHLTNKALNAAIAGDVAQFKHHTISTGATLANWRAHMLGIDTSMRPGIDPVESGFEAPDARVQVVMRFLATGPGQRVDRMALPGILELAGIPAAAQTVELVHHLALTLRLAGWTRFRADGGDRRWLYKRPAGRPTP